MEMDDQMGAEDGLPNDMRDGMDDSFEDFFRRTTEREAQNNVVEGLANQESDLMNSNTNKVKYIFYVFVIRFNQPQLISTRFKFLTN